MATQGQRRHRRYEVRDVHGSLLYRTPVQVRNLSVSGLALESDERLQLGRTYAIRLAGDRDSVELAGTIRWCHLASARPAAGGDPRAVYEAGFAFQDIFTERGRGLLGFLERHVFLSPHERVTGRFGGEALLNADLEARASFEVLRLSLSGMLVKTPLESAPGAGVDVEIGLRGGLVRTRGRVAYVERADPAGGGPATKLGVEFVDMAEDARLAVARYISAELERGPNGAARPPVS